MTERVVSSGDASDLCSDGFRFEPSSSVTKEPFLSHSLPQKILPDCIRSSVRFFGFRNNIFFFLQSKVISLASSPYPVFMSPSDRMAQLPFHLFLRLGGPR
jgi:hypothetical protein